MKTNYTKFLGQKLFLIEALSLKTWLETGDKNMKEIHNICIFSLPELEKYLGSNGGKDGKNI